MSEYYIKNKERIIKNAKEYYYSHHDEYVKYQKEYYQKNKERLNARRNAMEKTKRIGRPPRPQAPKVEKRKVLEVIPEPVIESILWNPNHTVVFD